MRVINLIWGYTLGAGIDKCYMTYATLPTLDESLEVRNVCINVLSRKSHIEPLKELNVTFIEIKSPADFSWIGKLERCIEEYNADVLFTHGFNGAIMALIEKCLKRIKADVILTYHGAYHAPTKKKLIEPIYNGLPHFIYKHISKVTICVAEYSRQYLPLLLPTVGGNGVSVKDKEHGLLVPPHDAEALADSLERLISDKSLREFLASSARKRFETEFTEEAMKRNLIKVLKS